MKIKKTVLAQLNKCYAIAPLYYQGKRQFVVAAEKADPCYLFDQDGTLQDTLWTKPGGVMTMVQVPGTDGQLLSTAKFYSPDESLEAKLVVVTPKSRGNWEMHTLTDIPHVHRFDILSRGGVNWLIVCTVKTGQDHPNGDFKYPGKVYTAILPEDLSVFDDDHQLKLHLLKDGLHRNHGYTRCDRNGVPASLVAADEGVWRLTPPETPDGAWKEELLLESPVSDAVLVDLDSGRILYGFNMESGFRSTTGKTEHSKKSGTFRKTPPLPTPSAAVSSQVLRLLLSGIAPGRKISWPSVMTMRRQTMPSR